MMLKQIFSKRIKMVKMKIYNNPNLNQKHHNSVIAIGNFDGLHLGHQKVIREAKQKAKKNRFFWSYDF